jgi:hypothetical protein
MCRNPFLVSLEEVMKFVKAVTIAAASAFVVSMSYGCSSTITLVDNSDGSTNTDGSVKKDVSQPGNDGSTNNEAGGTCGPVDTTGFKPRAYSPPSGKHQGKCTAQLITDYVACIEQTDKTKCNEFGQGQSGASCAACIETQATDSTWGPLVSPDGQTLNFNTPGCLDLAVPNSTCGKSLDASYGCQDAACIACDNTTTPDYSTCVDSSLKKQCKTYGDAADTACAVQFGDAAPTEVDNCFPDPSISDPAAQDADFVKRITTYFCGP